MNWNAIASFLFGVFIVFLFDWAKRAIKNSLLDENIKLNKENKELENRLKEYRYMHDRLHGYINKPKEDFIEGKFEIIIETKKLFEEFEERYLDASELFR